MLGTIVQPAFYFSQSGVHLSRASGRRALSEASSGAGISEASRLVGLVCTEEGALLLTRKRKREPPLQICFPDAETRDLYSHRERLIRKLGTRLADLVCCRLSVLQAAYALSILPATPPISLVRRSGRSPTYSVALGRSHELRIQAVAEESTDPDPTEVTRISILGVFETTSLKGRKL